MGLLTQETLFSLYDDKKLFLVLTIFYYKVLESLNKEGIPSRAEVTDAAMSNRAECVMLNKVRVDYLHTYTHTDARSELENPASVATGSTPYWTTSPFFIWGE